MQTSLAVQGLPSWQVVPSGIGMLMHAPVAGSHWPGW
jgi:hypothetical protein